MPKANAVLQAFNRGIVSRYTLARTDVEQLKLAAETQTNWLPRLLGPMMLRPGLAFEWETKSDNEAEVIPFVFALDDTAAIELTDSVMRVAVDDTLITRASVSTTVTNGDFSSSTGWTLSDSTISGGELTLVSPATGTVASAYRSVTVAAPDQATEHAFRIVVTNGPVVFKCGTSAGDDDVISRQVLDTGEHSLAFTPAIGTVYVYFETTTRHRIIVDSIQVESAGTMELPTPWSTSDLESLRYTQSGDIVFLCDGSHQQRKIERRSTTSWSVVLYRSDDGPFQSFTALPDITVTPSATIGNVTLTASAPLFSEDHLGSLIKITTTSQQVDASLAADDTYSDTIRIFGVGTDRDYGITITGTWTGTLTLQRSAIGTDTGFTDAGTYTGNASQTLSDAFDNETIYYRIGFKPSDYGSGTAVVRFQFPFGTSTGVARITEFATSTNVGAEVLSPIGSTTGTTNWRLQEWSDAAGWPTEVAFFDGRLWWFGQDREWGSVSDDYYSFDTEVEGDSGPIIRSIGRGPVDKVNFALPLTRLVIGTAATEISLRASSLDEPLTPTNFSQKDCSTLGSANVKAVKIDTRGIFVQKSKRKLFQLAYNVQAGDYQAGDLTRLAPEIAEDNFVKLAVQRQPDTRIHAICGDGTAAVLMFEPQDEIFAWWKIETDGLIENVFVLPGEVEDQVYYVVARTINGGTKRYVEKFARIDECRGGALSKLADSHVIYDGVATSTITGLSHLEGEDVVVWGDGADLGTETVSSGQITISASCSQVCAGLPYTAQYKSSKLAYAAGEGTALTQSKRVDHLGLILADTHFQGLEFGPDFDTLDSLPLVEDGAETAADTVWESYDNHAIEFPGLWTTDSRICLQATAPRPCTVMGAVISITTNG